MVLQVRQFALRIIELARKAAAPLALSVGLIGVPALAQQTDIPPPKAIAADANGVDLLSGDIAFSEVGNSIGPKGPGALSSSRIMRASRTLAGNIDSLNSFVKVYDDYTGLHTTMVLNGQSQNFSGEAGTPGTTPEHDAVGSFNIDATQASGIIYTAPDGTKAVFAYAQYNPLSGHAAIGRLSSITYPTGEVVTYSLIGVNTYQYKIESSLGYVLLSDTGEVDPIVANLTQGNCTDTACGGPTYASQHALGRAMQVVSTAPASNYTVTVTSAAGDGVRTYTMGASTWDGTGSAVSSVTKDGGTWTYSYAFTQDAFDPDPADGILTVTVTDPNGVKRIVRSRVSNGHVLSDQQGVTAQDTTGIKTTYGYQFDGANPGRPGFGRLSRVNMPEGDVFEYAYDGYANITSRKHYPKSGSGLSPTEVTASYSCRTTTAAPITTICNQPDWIRDELGHQTDFTYDPASGQVATVTKPAAPNGVRPQIRYTYQQVSATYIKDGSVVSGAPAWRVATTSTCRTQSSCVGTSDETVTEYGYETGTGSYHNARLVSVTTRSGNTTGPGAVSSTTTYAYNPRGDVIETDGPLTGNVDLVQTRYDASRWVVGTVGPDPDGGGALQYRASKSVYRADGQVQTAYAGVVADRSDATFANSFQVKSSVTTEFDAYARPVARVSANGSGTTFALAETSYDALGRVDCVATRMDATKFSNRLAACSPGANGTNDADRITKTTYDKYGQVMAIQSGVGVAPIYERRTTYTPNGKVESEKDGENNLTSYVYDGLDRLQSVSYPSPTKGAGSSNGGDYEQYGYDAAGNVTSRRLRGPSGITITSTYDNLNRLRTKTTPAADVAGTAYTYGYDNFDHPISTTDGTLTMTQGYDALGCLTSESGGVGAVTYACDAAGRRTRLTWPDGFYVTYEYDNANELTAIRRAGSDTLVTFAYDDLGRRKTLSRGNGVGTAYDYDAGNLLLASIAHTLVPAASADNVTYGLTYNAAGQIKTRTISNGTYAWNGATVADRGYTVNGLNQMTLVGSDTITNDARGNLKADGANSWNYDAENRLRGNGPGAALVYDPLGRLYQSTTAPAAGAVSTRYLYDGPNLIGEYDGSNVLQRRYVFGAGADEVLVQYMDAGTTPEYLLADHQGSIVAATGPTGAIATQTVSGATVRKILTYDEYGKPGPSNLGLFQYTGQVYLADLSLYHYKARAYSPVFGRFLQTDPTGYDDGLNWYAYVGNDPLNRSDPTGTQTTLPPPVSEVFVNGINYAKREAAYKAWLMQLTFDNAMKDMRTRWDEGREGRCRALESFATNSDAVSKQTGDVAISAVGAGIVIGAVGVGTLQPEVVAGGAVVVEFGEAASAVSLTAKVSAHVARAISRGDATYLGYAADAVMLDKAIGEVTPHSVGVGNLVDNAAQEMAKKYQSKNGKGSTDPCRGGAK